MQTISFFPPPLETCSLFCLSPVFWNCTWMCLGLGIFTYFSGHSEALFIWKLMTYKFGKPWFGVRKISIAEIPIAQMLDLQNRFSWSYSLPFSSFWEISSTFNPSIEFLTFDLMSLTPQRPSLFSGCPRPRFLFHGCNVLFYTSEEWCYFNVFLLGWSSSFRLLPCPHVSFSLCPSCQKLPEVPGNPRYLLMFRSGGL